MPQGFDTVYAQIQDYVLERIRAGEFKPGERLPSERELASILDVSRGSVREALRHMERAGQLVRVERVGYFVGPGRLVFEPDRLLTFTHTVGGEGYRPGARVLEAVETLPSREIRETLHLAVGEPVYLIRRLRLASEQPAIIETVYLPASLCPGLIDIDLNDQSMWGIMLSQYHVDLAQAEITLGMLTLDAGQAALLEVPVGAPAFVLTRLTHDSQGKPIEFDHEIYRGDIVEFHIRAAPNHSEPSLHCG